jgi:hypothetical protein
MEKEGEMELLERYLQAVRFLLPKKQRHDVDRELSEDLRSLVEEKEAELGRRLNEDELAVLLKRFGHPVVLALRYQQGRYLIGPAVFPLYWLAARSVLGILAVVHILLPVMFFVFAGEPPERIVGVFLRFPGVALPVLAWITLGFAILETPVVWSAIERSLSRWRPQSLPPIVKEEPARPPSVAGLVLGALLSAWWLAGLQFPTLLLGPAADYIRFGPIFYRLYVPMAVVAIARLALGWFRLARPHCTIPLRMGGLFVDALDLVVLYLLAKGGDWVVAGERLSREPGSGGLIEIANLGAGLGLWIAFVVAAVTFVWRHFIRTRGWPWQDGTPAHDIGR